ncbi:MAG TPA: guanylate kinase [Gemmatimonadaceae bacterium]|nr:guanylate kinase [Gemmatimonadaceae bacterium]
MKPVFPVILSSPSGGGKTTIAKALLARRQDIGYSVSCTTRAPRAGEANGKDYYFLTEQEFIARRVNGDFAESAQVHGLWYGTLRSEVEKVLGSGKHVILDIDVQGAAQFRRAFPQAVLVFVLPPSGESLLERLRERGTENAAQLTRRLQSAIAELKAVPEYQYVVINDELERAVQRVAGIIDAETMRRERLTGLERDLRSIVERLEREIDT